MLLKQEIACFLATIFNALSFFCLSQKIFKMIFIGGMSKKLQFLIRNCKFYSNSTVNSNRSFWRPITVLGLTSVGLFVYYKHQHNKYLQSITSLSGQIGTPSLGGPFCLTSNTGQVFDSKTIKGKYQLIYFGFTHCPDICPEELEKLGKVIKGLEELKRDNLIVPIFVTCDPKRDGPEELTYYLKGNFLILN